MSFFALVVLCSLLISSHPFRLAILRNCRQSLPHHSEHVQLARNVLCHAERALDAVQSWRQTDAERGLVQNIESAGDWRLLLDNPACSTLVQRLDALNRSSSDNLLAFAENVAGVVDVLRAALGSQTSNESEYAPQYWARRACTQLQHAWNALAKLHLRLLVRRSRQSQQPRHGYGARTAGVRERHRTQYLEHIAPQLEPECRLEPFVEAPVKLMLQLEVAFWRLADSAQVLVTRAQAQNEN